MRVLVWPVVSQAFELWKTGSYRLLVGVTAVSSFGFWFHATTLVWVVYSLTGSPTMVGLISFFQWGPYAVLGLFSIGVVDYFDKRVVLLGTQSGYAICALFLAALAFTDMLGAAAIFASCIWLSLLLCVDQPARQGLVAAIVAPADLSTILGLNASINGVARIAAPALAGLVIATFGIRYCFVPIMLTSAVNVFGLYFLTRSLAVRRSKAFRPLTELTKGFRIIADDRVMLTLFIVLFFVTTLPLSFQVILLAFSHERLGGGPSTFGSLMSCVGFGSFLGSIWILLRKPTVRATLACAIGVGLAQFGLSFQTHFLPAAILAAAGGGCGLGLVVGANSHILGGSDKSAHSRVGGLYRYIVTAIGPLGSAIMGLIVSRGGAQLGLVVGATIAIASGAVGLIAVSGSRESLPGPPSSVD